VRYFASWPTSLTLAGNEIVERLAACQIFTINKRKKQVLLVLVKHKAIKGMMTPGNLMELC
jgi:hypothetical protein